MWKSRTGHAAENPGHWPSERRGKGEARTALLEGPKPVCRNPRVSLWHETQTNRLCLIWRTAVYGPVCTVVWEGRSREAPPYPDSELRHAGTKSTSSPTVRSLLRHLAADFAAR